VELTGVERSAVFGECVRDGLILGVVTGAVSGTVAAPVIGTILGALFGFVVAIPVALIVAAAISGAVVPSATVESFRRRVDVTFAIFAVAIAALAIGWISLEALVGAWPAIAMFVVVVVGLLIIRRRLHKLASPSPA
jgi:hypothetical protein